MGHKMATGFFANAQISPSIVQRYTSIPLDAVVEGNGEEAFVFVIENGKAKKVPIKISYFNNNTAYLSNGLGGIKEVVIDGSAYLVEGAKVKIIK